MSNLFSFYGNVEGSDIRISCFELWRRVILDNLKKDDSNQPKFRNYNWYGCQNATMSGKDNISFYYTLDGYPSQLPIGFKDSIRREARDGVRISFISLFEPTYIDWNSPQMRSKLKTWKTIEEDDLGNVDEYNYQEKMSYMDSMSRRKQSLVYLADAERRRKRKLFRYRTLMIISGVRGENFDKTVFEVNSYCKSNLGLEITRVSEELGKFLRAFSPFCLESSDIMKKVGSNTIPDEQLARLSTYDQGKIGKGGIMFGTDIYSGFTVYKQMKKKDTDAENILITAETGGGKSFFLKFILLQLLALDEYRGTVNDIEGFEYIPMAGFIANHDKVVVLNMAEGQGCYYDPFEITLSGHKDSDKDMFDICKSFSSSVFKAIIGKKLLDSDPWVDTIVDNAIALAYASLGVDEFDMSTWSRTRGYDLYYVYKQFKILYNECLEISKMDEGSIPLHIRYKSNEGYRSSLDMVIARLVRYFEPLENGGIRNGVFRNKVSLADIVDAKLVVNSFGMAGKSADTVDETQMALSQLSAANISHIRSIFSKAHGKYNFKVWEEFQRWGAFPDSANTIKTAITGGRKLGDVNFIVTNNVKDLLDDDKFAIFDNITSFAVGAIGSAETRKRVCEQLSVPMLQGDLDSLVLKKGNTESFETDGDTSSIYDKAFLIQLDKSVTTISKMMLPRHVAESNIFKTGVDLKGTLE